MDYRKIGRSHARKALKSFFANQAAHQLACGCNELSMEINTDQCIECLKNEVYDLFRGLVLKETTRGSFRYPSDQSDEDIYNESATELIDNTILRTFSGSRVSSQFRGEGAITEGEEAYQAGKDWMSELLSRVNLDPEEINESAEETLKEKVMGVAKAGGEPRVHEIMKVYFERGMEDALKVNY